MPASDVGPPSSPLPPGATPEETTTYYKAQYELVEAELAEFQASSKDLEAELERDIDAAEKRERELRDKAGSLQFEVNEWREKYKQAKIEAGVVQGKLQREITELRDTTRSLQLRLRDIEVANDDYERQQRNTESSLEDMESQYNQAIERSVLLEEEVRSGEKEREILRIEEQRLRDELSDLKIEADITREKLRKSEVVLVKGRASLVLASIPPETLPQSEHSPTTTTSSRSVDTLPANTASSSTLSDTPTPPSPPVSDRSAPNSISIATPSNTKIRMSINTSNITPRQSFYNARTPGHTREPSIPINTTAAPSSSYRLRKSGVGAITQNPAALPQSTSIMQLRNLRSKMQRLEDRVHSAKSKLPAAVMTPPLTSPASGPTLGQNIPSSVTVRSGRKRTGHSDTSGCESIPDQGLQTPTTIRPRQSRLSNVQRALPTPGRGDMAAPPRPASRASISSHSSFVPGHSRPGSRARLSGFGTPLGSAASAKQMPNASTDCVRPKSSLSNHGYDGVADEEYSDGLAQVADTTHTSRRLTFGKRTSNVGTAIPSPSKRLSFGGTSNLPGLSGRRPSPELGNMNKHPRDLRSPSRLQGSSGLNDVEEVYDIDETF